MALLAGCGEDPPARPVAEPPPERPRRAERPPAPVCPADLDNCVEATGRVLYVEAVDPDGDGDAHYVLAGGGVTGPGLTVVDVVADLRPRRLPRVGTRVSAAGPVYRGSFGQRQIQALAITYG